MAVWWNRRVGWFRIDDVRCREGRNTLAILASRSSSSLSPPLSSRVSLVLREWRPAHIVLASCLNAPDVSITSHHFLPSYFVSSSSLPPLTAAAAAVFVKQRVESLAALLTHSIGVHCWFNVDGFYVLWPDRVTFRWVSHLFLRYNSVDFR